MIMVTKHEKMFCNGNYSWIDTYVARYWLGNIFSYFSIIITSREAGREEGLYILGDERVGIFCNPLSMLLHDINLSTVLVDVASLWIPSLQL